MILNKLESGLLLFDTPQGYVAVEPSFRERLYLLWTFRNFRQLSLPLLNARQNALIKDLARKNTAAKMERYDALRVIGVVENFSLPKAKVTVLPTAITGTINTRVSEATISAAAMNAAVGETPTRVTAGSVTVSAPPGDVPEFLVAGEKELTGAAEEEPVAAVQLALQQSESALPEEREIVEDGIAARVSESMQTFWSLTAAELARLKPAESKLPKFNLPKFNLPKLSLAKFNVSTAPEASVSETEFKRTLEAPKSNSAMFNLAPARLATSAGVIALCLGTVAAWHRIEGVMSSEAHAQAQVTDAGTAARTELAIAKPMVDEAASNAVSALTKADIITTRDVQLKIAGESRELASIRPGSDVATVHDQSAPLPARKIARRGIVSTSKLPLATIESGIQATRPPLRFVYPRYADLSARGVVALTADVDATGAVRSVRVVKGNRSLASAAMSAVRKWRYRPYLKDGHPVATETNIVISFFSNDAITMSFPPSVAMAR